jgi:hypothetical protein
MHIIQSRRDFLTTLSAAGAICTLDARTALADEGPPETTTVRLPRFFPASCEIPEYVAGELLRAEGFTASVLWKDKAASTRRSGSRAASWISTGTTQRPTSPRSKPAYRSRCWRACTRGALS